MKKRLISILLCLIIVLSLFPVNVFADGWRCPSCDEWFEEEYYCQACENCVSCVGELCDWCFFCEDCIDSTHMHCKECGACRIESGFDEDGSFCCANCGKCHECADFNFEDLATTELLCDECFIEQFGEVLESGNLCENCGRYVWTDGYYDELDRSAIEEYFEIVDPGLCEEHCEECYEENCCEICGMCFLCEGEDMQCPYCGLCYDCALDEEMHCENCYECFNDVDRCESGGNHCVSCCEEEGWLCENCGRCCEAMGLERCPDCGYCEDCIEDNSMHCTLCDECYVNIDRCEDDGEHCVDCCYSEGWLCENCGQCTEALGIEKCEYCDYCIDCCNEFTIIEGGEEGHCLMNDDEADYWRDIEENGSMTGNHHIGSHQFLYTTTRSSHQGYCTIRGCLYKGKWEEHTFADKKVLIPPTAQQDGKVVKVCTVCGYQSTVDIVHYGENFEIPNRYYTVTVPKAGAKPDNSFRGGGKALYYDEILKWQKLDGGNYVDMKPTEIFKAGVTYAAVITLVPKSGITISMGSGTKVVINDQDVTNTKAGLSFFYYCTPKVVEEVETIELIEVTVPGYRIGGNIADAVPTVDTKGITVLSYCWMSGGSFVTDGQFKEGREYTVSLNLVAEKGYEIKRYCDGVAWVSDAGFSGHTYGGGTEGGVHYDAMTMFTLPKLESDGTKTLSGKVTSFGKSSEATVIQLFVPGSDEVAYETIATGLTANYSISGIVAGTYTMKVSKTGHITGEFTVTVNTDTIQNVALQLSPNTDFKPGDIDGNKSVNLNDVTRLAQYVAKWKVEVNTPALDTDGNGSVNLNDVTRLAQFVAKWKVTLSSTPYVPK